LNHYDHSKCDSYFAQTSTFDKNMTRSITNKIVKQKKNERGRGCIIHEKSDNSFQINKKLTLSCIVVVFPLDITINSRGFNGSIHV
jgi:hypothetical protein